MIVVSWDLSKTLSFFTADSRIFNFICLYVLMSCCIRLWVKIIESQILRVRDRMTWREKWKST